MGEIQTFWFLVVAIVFAIVFGRLGTMLREQIEKANVNNVIGSKFKKLKTNKLS